ncbi:stage V sporulation protein G [bacterium]|nr:stage V sporulation protein G [bacterium]
MRITEVRIKLMDDPSDRLCAFCSITLDECFVIRDLKIIHGAKGAFVAMPSRKLTDRCPKCHSKNHLRATFCNQCGVRLHSERASKDDDGRAKLYADIAHPINSECRDQIQQMVIAAYEEELVKAKLDGYVCTYDDFEEDRYASLNDENEAGSSSTGNPSNSHTSSERGSSSGNGRQQPEGRQQSEKPDASRVRMTMETEAGKMLRVDSARGDEKNQRHAESESKREQQPATRPAGGESFGDGII